MEEIIMSYPRISTVLLLPYSVFKEEINFVLSCQLSFFTLIGGQIQKQDEHNSLAFAFRILTQHYSDLAKLSYVLSKSHEPKEDSLSKWLLHAIAQTSLLILSNRLILPLRISTELDSLQIKQILKISQHQVALVPYQDISEYPIKEEELYLLKLAKQKIEEASIDESYFALINCRYPTHPESVSDMISLYLIGSVLSESDQWRNFQAPMYQLPSIEDIKEGKLRGVMITGCACACYEQLGWILNLKTFLKDLSAYKDIKILGTCFGHQILALALGGSVGRVGQGIFIVKQERVHFNCSFKALPFVNQPNIKKEMVFQEMHGDEITSLPAGYKLYGSSASCKYECVGKGTQIFSSQFHPEYTRALMRERYLPQFKKGLNKEEEELLEKYHSGGTDNLSFRQIQYNFLHSD